MLRDKITLDVASGSFVNYISLKGSEISKTVLMGVI